MTLNDRLAAYFRAHPNQWLDGRDLARIAGYAGWRTRVSNLRTQRGMTIENRCRRFPDLVISEYRYRVSDPEQLPLSDQWSVGA